MDRLAKDQKEVRAGKLHSRTRMSGEVGQVFT